MSALKPAKYAEMRCVHAGEAVQCLEKARQIAAAVHGRDHPILESFWEALAEAKREVCFCLPVSALQGVRSRGLCLSLCAQKTCNSRLWWTQPLIQWFCWKCTGPVFF